MLLLFTQSAVALPDFAGPRTDDMPVPQPYLISAYQKNVYVGLADLSEVKPGPDEILIRLYAGFGDLVLASGAPPLDLKAIHVSADVPTLLWYPPCPAAPATLIANDPESAWNTLLEQEIFTIPDFRSVPDYQRVVDGITYLIQIRTTDAYREFIVSNPQFHASDDNTRLLTALDALADAFDSPATCL